MTSTTGQPLDDENVSQEEAQGIEEAADILTEESKETLLSEEIEKQKEEAKKYYDQCLRALADVENIKKRTQRDKEEYIKYGNVSLIKKILPILDDLERAIAVSQTSNDREALQKGVEMTAKNLLDLLTNEGLQVIEAEGKPFDPQVHQPLVVEATDAFPENTVMEVMQRGYILHDRVIRPALVKVSST
ncbi:MAG: nucleotide exchange factor GrpE [Bacillota bacterium]|nr:nucleotide exchange factor GrpE [Bacillota bacterium]